jgi:ABC-type antimicrobial peptide transport system permease subunit
MSRAKQIAPPRWAERLLSWYAGRAHIEDLVGDLEEIFYDEVEQSSVRRAKLNYCHQVLALIFSYALKKRQVDQSYHPLSITQNNTAMFRNYIKVAVRSLARNKFFTIINVLGLSLGMSITVLYIGFMGGLFRFDKFHENFDTIYKVVSKVDLKTEVRAYESAPASIVDVLQENYTGIGKTVKINDWVTFETAYKGKELPMSGLFTEPSFFEIFSFNMINGSTQSALSNPYQVILTNTAADKLFSGQDPIGQVISLGDLGEYTVSGVMEDPPKGSHLNFELLVSYNTLAVLRQNNKLSQISDANEWNTFRDNYTHTYLQLTDDQVSEVELILNEIASNKYQHNKEMSASFSLLPMSQIVMGSTNFNNNIGPYFGGAAMYAFGAITLLILLPACFNYSSISISRSMKRAKEIGIRKVVGGHKKQIWLQFITETVIISLVALIGSIGIFFLIKERFADMLVGGDFVDFDVTTMMIISFIIFAIVTGVLAGVVPAAYFSKIDPVVALKGPSSMKIFGKTSFKKILIVGQFTLSLFFIIGVVVMLKQVKYSLNYDMGFDQKNLLDVPLRGVDKEIFKTEFAKHGAVSSISMSSHVIGAEGFSRDWLFYTDQKDSIQVRQMFIDENYISNLGLSIVAGEDFKTITTHDETSIIVNEAFLETLELTSTLDVLGKLFLLDNGEMVKIVGVVKDFNYSLLRDPISNFVFRYNPEEFRYANVKVTTTDNFNMLSDMEATWKALGQEQKFESKFFDKEIEEAYQATNSMTDIFSFMGFLAITVACLGLLGMVVYSTETRAKEVGVRKVMGASVQNLVYLLSKEYMKLMLIAALIAIPTSYFFFNFMLTMQQYYSVTVGSLDIIISLGLLLLIGAVTMASQTIKTALANPTDTLGSE